MKKPCLLVSACLLGTPCRYDGRSKPHPAVAALAERYTLVPVCPEEAGGLPTPREPSERQGARVVSRSGEDVTAAYRKGAEAALATAKACGAVAALLKEEMEQAVSLSIPLTVDVKIGSTWAEAH